MNRAVIKLVFGTLTFAVAQPTLARPIFVGTSKVAMMSHARAPSSSLSYMTADQMAERVTALTGFYQPGFAEFGSIIGKLDPRTGVRTNDRPTVMSVMLIEQLVQDVAETVLAREQFLDDDDRIVFIGLDLRYAPNDATLRQFVADTCSSWLIQVCPADLEQALIDDFRHAEANTEDIGDAWTALISSLLQNGTIYFY